MDSGRSQHYIKAFDGSLKIRLLAQLSTGECNSKNEF